MKIIRCIRLVELAIPEIKIDASEVVKNGCDLLVISILKELNVYRGQTDDEKEVTLNHRVS